MCIYVLYYFLILSNSFDCLINSYQKFIHARCYASCFEHVQDSWALSDLSFPGWMPETNYLKFAINSRNYHNCIEAYDILTATQQVL